MTLPGSCGGLGTGNNNTTERNTMKWINPENNLVGAVKQLQGILQDGYKVPKPKVVKVKETVFPPELNKPDFLRAWNEWTQHRIEIKKKLTPSTARKQLKLL